MKFIRKSHADQKILFQCNFYCTVFMYIFYKSQKIVKTITKLASQLKNLSFPLAINLKHQLTYKYPVS